MVTNSFSQSKLWKLWPILNFLDLYYKNSFAQPSKTNSFYLVPFNQKILSHIPVLCTWIIKKIIIKLPQRPAIYFIWYSLIFIYNTFLFHYFFKFFNIYYVSHLTLLLLTKKKKIPVKSLLTNLNSLNIFWLTI